MRLNMKELFNRKYTFFELKFSFLIAISCILPLAGLFLCETICILFDFKQSTATNCDGSVNVRNFLPSVSEAIGRLSPQKYIWRIFIALHATPRFVIATGYYSIHTMMFYGINGTQIYHQLSRVAYTLHLVEILALIGLSFVSSTEDYEIHKLCFMTFMLCATLHMMSMCVLHSLGKKAVKFSLSWEERLSQKWKLAMFMVNSVFVVAALYFFHRHNKYCEDGVYSLFAVCEIIIILTNIGFHGTAVLDFNGSHLVLQDSSQRWSEASHVV